MKCPTCLGEGEVSLDEACKADAPTGPMVELEPIFNEREIATILAALRYWQREGWRSGGAEIDIATNGGKYDEPLEDHEIDALCMKINCVDEEPVTDEERSYGPGKKGRME